MMSPRRGGLLEVGRDAALDMLRPASLEDWAGKEKRCLIFLPFLRMETHTRRCQRYGGRPWRRLFLALVCGQDWASGLRGAGGKLPDIGQNTGK